MDVERESHDRAITPVEWFLLNGEFHSAECYACDEIFRPDECTTDEWSSVGGPRVGAGGERLLCPNGHVLTVHRTWVS